MAAHIPAPAAPAPEPPGPGTVRIGCSGWIYQHWRGLFYPPGLPVKRWFAHYAAEFATVEINNSFYRLPKPETFAAWRDQAPPGFQYAVKANRYVTQAKKLKDGEETVPRIMEPIRQLGETLGPVLYQLPPRFRLNLDRLERFLEILPRDVTSIFEFRDASWYDDRVFAALERAGAGFCSHDMPGLQSPRMAFGRAAYVRFHGGEGKYWGRYPDERLLDWADWLAAEARRGREVWAYFNNDIEGHAVHDARTLRAMVRQMQR